MNRWISAARGVDPSRLYDGWRSLGIEALDETSFDWPKRLLNDPQAPVVMFSKGSLRLAGPAVTIVGTRRCSAYGRRVASKLGADLAARGITVVSGLALGVDAAAHRGALDTGGEVVGVVGSGLDVVYPRRNRDLWLEVASVGRLWSEYPPGMRPRSWHFPARNRILAGLGDVVVVVESGVKGGSLHTVDSALERNVTVLAVPGQIDSRASIGTNRLLIQGATPCTGVEDVLVALGLSAPDAVDAAISTTPAQLREEDLDANERAVLDACGAGAASVSELVLRCGMSLGAVIEIATRLEMYGVLVNRGGWYEIAK
ncbi:MAG: DNA-protecting protein DprA [Actinomycetia bacterium]|nr:DNA-protecting protein DprA [Actinomycetes bacterium]